MPSSKAAPKRAQSALAENAKTIIYAVLIAVTVRTVAFEPFNIPSGSMIPTLLVGDYLFVHAGIRPGVPLGQQERDDLMWIRDEFLDSGVDHGKVVVHGHSIRREPEVRSNRIGIDTGAFSTGRLTALVLEGETMQFIQTRGWRE